MYCELKHLHHIDRNSRTGHHGRHIRGERVQMSNDKQSGNLPVDFLTRFTQSEQFSDVFNQGMGLVEETANYLDGPGRADARLLDRHGSIAYATESMRLTTRLMQLASWLLLQRAISSGELTPEAAMEEKKRINLSEIGEAQEMSGASQLPQALQDLVARSTRVHGRIIQLDKMIRETAMPDAQAENPIGNQLDRLAQAFGGRK